MLLESVPNVSLGPQDEALDDVLGCVREATTPGCRLLDVHTDRDHRRTVLTLAGAPVPLVRVLTELADALDQQASLAGHDGVHPRVGLLDVVPFVALEAPREAAHRAARAFGQRMSTREVPVYGYGESSPTAQARPLAAIRRAMEGAELGEPAPLKPQQGPARPHPAMGATCVGVRDPLIAYNVVLDTDDIEVGRSIARSVRASSGGLVGLQALAFRLGSREDRVQVSTNITDADRLSLADVYEAVEQAADEAGVDVLEGELVGLAPSKALPKKAKGAGLRTRPVSLEDALLDAGYNVDEER